MPDSFRSSVLTADLPAAPPGVDLQAGLRLTGGKLPRYLSFLRMYVHDSSLSELQQSLSRGDLSGAFISAHTLKGLCAQLGLTQLAALSGHLCELLRPQQPDVLPDARILLAELTAANAEVLAFIAGLDSSV